MHGMAPRPLSGGTTKTRIEDTESRTIQVFQLYGYIIEVEIRLKRHVGEDEE